MFTVAQFFEKQQLRVLAVPVSWVHDGCLMWPKIPSNEKLDKLRTGGNEFHGATKKIPAIMGRKFKTLQAAEAAAEDLLKLEISDVDTKRKLLKRRREKSVVSRPLKDYNKIIHGKLIVLRLTIIHLIKNFVDISSSKKPVQKSDFIQSPPQAQELSPIGLASFTDSATIEAENVLDLSCALNTNKIVSSFQSQSLAIPRNEEQKSYPKGKY